MISPTTQDLRTRLEAMARGADSPPATIGELVERYLKFCQDTYPARAGSSTYSNARDATRPLKALYEHEAIESIGVVEMEAVRILMVEDGLSRRTINDRMARIRTMYRMMKFGHLIDQVTLPGLRRKRNLCGLKVNESKGVKPVPDSVFWATEKFMAPVISAMCRIMWWTGCRPGEVCSLTGECLDLTTWTATLAEHKTAHHGKDRTIYFGPHARDIIQPHLKPGCIFLSQYARPYHPNGLLQEVYRAADAAGVNRWFPNQIRHAAATRFRREAGAETAQVLLGHANLSTTEIYAEQDRATAMQAAMNLG